MQTKLTDYRLIYRLYNVLIYFRISFVMDSGQSLQEDGHSHGRKSVIYSDSLLKKLTIDNVNVTAISGAKFADLRRLVETSPPPPNTNIIICGGINDVGQGLGANVIIRHAKHLKERLLKVSNCRVVFCTVPYAPKYCDLYMNNPNNEWIIDSEFTNRAETVTEVNKGLLELNDQTGEQCPCRLDRIGTRQIKVKGEVKRKHRTNIEEYWLENSVRNCLHLSHKELERVGRSIIEWSRLKLA